MLTQAQKDLIQSGIVTDLPIHQVPTGYLDHWVPQPPDIIMHVPTEGVRQSCFLDCIYDRFDGSVWTEKRGHISRATIALIIEMMDTEDLEAKARQLWESLWKTEAGLNPLDHLWFRGCGPPRPMYSYSEDPTFPYRYVIEYFVDYFDTFTVEVPAITSFGVDINEAVSELIKYPLHRTFPYSLRAYIKRTMSAGYSLDALIVE